MAPDPPDPPVSLFDPAFRDAARTILNELFRLILTTDPPVPETTGNVSLFTIFSTGLPDETRTVRLTIQYEILGSEEALYAAAEKEDGAP